MPSAEMATNDNKMTEKSEDSPQKATVDLLPLDTDADPDARLPPWFKTYMRSFKHDLYKQFAEFMARKKQQDESGVQHPCGKCGLDAKMHLRLKFREGNLPQHWDAEIIRHTNYPDWSPVGPGCTITKCWVISNTGLSDWDTNTKLLLISGNIPTGESEVSVPPTKPNETCTVSVKFVTPMESGVYRSNWSLSHNEVQFGCQVSVCVVVVSEKEKGEENAVKKLPEIKTTEEMVDQSNERTACNGEQEQVESNEELLSAKTFMFDLKDHRSTPMTLSPPPNSPASELEEITDSPISSGSSVEVVSETSSNSTSDITQLDRGHNDDIETCSTSSGESWCFGAEADGDTDSCVIPLPDCFNPNLPMSASTTDILVTHEDILSIRNEIRSAYNALNVPSLELDPSMPAREESPVSGAEQESTSMVMVELPTEEMPPAEVVTEETADNSPTPASVPTPVIPTLEPIIHPAAEVAVKAAIGKSSNDMPATPDNASLETQTQGEATHPEDGDLIELTEKPAQNTDDLDPNSGEADKDAVTAGPHKRPITPPQPHQENCDTPISSTIRAASLMTAALGAAATAYTKAKDVFHTLQANSQYVPPKSNWKPPQNVWLPPTQDYVLPKQTWTPPPQQHAWTPAQWIPQQPVPLPPTVTAPTERAVALSPMDQLIELGFANREMNKMMLDRHNQDIQKVIDDIFADDSNDWHQQRH